MKNIDSHIDSIITRKISGEITPDEMQVLTDWLQKNPDNKQYFDEIQSIYTRASSNQPDATPPIDIEIEWQRFKSAVEPATKSQTSWLRIAASIIIIGTLGYFIWTAAFLPKNINVVAENSGQVVTLPDNSVVTLNKGATITYSHEFSAESREIELSGEAFFEVTRDESKPFRVNLGLTKVEVLGTSFNINSGNENEITEVIVNSGKVKFATINDEFVILTKGEKGMFMKTNNSITKAANSDVNFMAWKTRKLVFNEMELDEVIKALNRLYETQIFFSTDVSKNCKVTVTFENQSLEAILSVLEHTLNLEYKKSGDIIEVVKSDC